MRFLLPAHEFAVAAEFLAQVLRALEEEHSQHRRHSLRRVAHELRTPLTTLRLALQVALGHLEKGGTVESTVLHKAIGLADKLAAKISELVARSDDGLHEAPTSNTP